MLVNAKEFVPSVGLGTRAIHLSMLFILMVNLPVSNKISHHLYSREFEIAPHPLTEKSILYATFCISYDLIAVRYLNWPCLHIKVTQVCLDDFLIMATLKVHTHRA